MTIVTAAGVEAIFSSSRERTRCTTSSADCSKEAFVRRSDHTIHHTAVYACTTLLDNVWYRFWPGIMRISAFCAHFLLDAIPFFCVLPTSTLNPQPSTLTQGQSCASLPLPSSSLAISNQVSRFHDVGVAGLHRLLAAIPSVERAGVAICVAGMDGAMPGVVAGLVKCPVVAVPTSVGYGAAMSGLAPLLTMLNACAPGVSVVNIDNGFGAAAFAVKLLKSGKATATAAAADPAT